VKAGKDDSTVGLFVVLRHIPRLGFLLVFVSVLRLCGAVSAADLSRPNFLVILVDDMGYSDLGCYGSEIRTPNIDSLAEGGMRFTQMYNTAKCYPTRASLLTGLYFQRTNRDFFNTATIGEVLRPEGYRTLWSGKHHAGFNPTTRGFDRFYGLLGGACNYFNPGGRAAPGRVAPAYKGLSKWVIDDRLVERPVPEDPKFYTTDAFTDQALKWLDEYKDEDKPFFLYVAYNAPHWPLHAWPEDIAKYKGVYDEGYEAVRNARYERQVKMGLMDLRIAPLSEPDWGGKVWRDLADDDKKTEAMRMEIHAAMVDRVDQNVGRIVCKLKEFRKIDNTLILFLIDNGASPETTSAKYHGPDAPMGSVASFESIGRAWATVANTPLRKWKTSSHEGGACTPMIVHWPDRIKQQGKFYREPAHLIDIMATITDIARARYPGEVNGQHIPPMEGVSLLPALSGGRHTRTNPLFWQFGNGSAIREGRWKLVRSGWQWELYDMLSDRTETNDLASAHPAMVKRMGQKWDQWYKGCTGTEYSLPNRKDRGKRK